MDSAVQQKNSRSTNIHRLRQLLELFDNLELKYANKQWQFLLPNNLFLDVEYYNKEMANNNFDPEIDNLKLNKTLQIDKFDAIIARFNEINIEQIQGICKGLDVKKEGQLLQKLSERWLSIDSLSDEALAYLLKALFYNRRKQKALIVYGRFCNNYKQLLDESYRYSFEDCINGKSVR